MNDDLYAKIDVRVSVVTSKAVLFMALDDAGEDFPRRHWVPLSLVHGASERKLVPGYEGEIRVMAWKLEALGL